MCWPCCLQIYAWHTVEYTPVGYGSFTRLDTETGEPLWTADFGNDAAVSYGTSGFFGINREAWQGTITYRRAANAIVYDDAIYVTWLPSDMFNYWQGTQPAYTGGFPDGPLSNGGVARLNHDGEIVWNTVFPKWARSAPEHAQWVNDDRVYDNAKLIAVRFQFKPSISIDHQGHIWVVTKPDEYLNFAYKVDAETGEILGKYSPTFASPGLDFVSTVSGTGRAFRAILGVFSGLYNNATGLIHGNWTDLNNSFSFTMNLQGEIQSATAITLTNNPFQLNSGGGFVRFDTDSWTYGVQAPQLGFFTNPQSSTPSVVFFGWNYYNTAPSYTGVGFPPNGLFDFAMARLPANELIWRTTWPSQGYTFVDGTRFPTGLNPVGHYLGAAGIVTNYNVSTSPSGYRIYARSGNYATLGRQIQVP